MNVLIEKLLEPISPEQPCGPDLYGDPMFDELVALLKGAPDVDIGNVKKPAEPPDWRELQEKSIVFLQRSKHLRVAVMLCGSLLKTGRLAGFRDGLQLVRGLVEQYWTTLHPQLDPEYNNDPTERLNILKALTEPRGSLGVGWLTIVDFLCTTLLLEAKAAPVVTFDQLRAAKHGGGGTGPSPGGAPVLLAAAFRNAGPAQIAVPRQHLEQALETVRGLDQFLTKTLGKANTISFDVLEQCLEEMLALLKSGLTGGSNESVPTAAIAEGADNKVAPDTGKDQVRGPIRSSNDVLRALDEICEYYRQIEPGSPVPYLLRRAQKLAKMDFVQAVQELNLATMDTLRPSMGSALATENPAGNQPAAPS